MSKSSSSSAQSSNATDNKAAAGDNSVVATGGSTINYLSSDVAQQALEAAVTLGKASLDQSGDLVSGAFDFLDKQADVTESARVGNENFARDLANTAIQKVEQNAQSADVQVLSTVGKYIAWGIGALAAVFALWVVFRRPSKSRP